MINLAVSDRLEACPTWYARSWLHVPCHTAFMALGKHGCQYRLTRANSDSRPTPAKAMSPQASHSTAASNSSPPETLIVHKFVHLLSAPHRDTQKIEQIVLRKGQGAGIIFDSFRRIYFVFYRIVAIKGVEMKKALTTVGCLLALVAVPYAHGAVVLQDTYAPVAPLGIPTDIDPGVGVTFGYEVNLNPATEFSAAGHSKLIMVLSGKNEDQGGESDFAGAPVTAIRYDGVSLNQAMFHDGGGFNRVSVGIYYLDNVASDGTLRIEFADANQTEFGFGLYAVDGLKSGVQDVAEGTSDAAAEVDLTTASGFLVQEAARNNQSLTGGGDYTTLYSYSVQSYRGLSQYQVIDGTGPGSYFAPINNTGAFKYVGGAAFEAIPEPASLALLGLGGLLIAGRRRHA